MRVVGADAFQGPASEVGGPEVGGADVGGPGIGVDPGMVGEAPVAGQNCAAESGGAADHACWALAGSHVWRWVGWSASGSGEAPGGHCWGGG
jgi:hypothetical protein